MQYSQIVRKVVTAVMLVVGFGLMSGCASDFVRPAPDTIKLGKSTAEEVANAVSGSPMKRKNVSINNEKVDLLTYMHVGSATFYGSVIPHRSLTYTFYNDVLVGEELNSTYDAEKTEFDVKKVPEIHKGQTRDQVMAIMGQPSGRILYPLIADKTGSGLVYAYSYARFAPLVSPSWSYQLIITFDNSDRATNISYKENGKETIADARN